MFELNYPNINNSLFNFESWNGNYQGLAF